MNAYVVPVIRASIIGLSVEGSSSLIQATLLAAGFATAAALGDIDLTAVSSAALISRLALPLIDSGIKFDLMSVITMIVLYFIINNGNHGNVDCHQQCNGGGVDGKARQQWCRGPWYFQCGQRPAEDHPYKRLLLQRGNPDDYEHLQQTRFQLCGSPADIVGFSSKISSSIAVIPSAAVGGIFLLTSRIITGAGINMFKVINAGMKETCIVAIGLNVLPAGALDALSVFAQYILGFSIASAAIILNKIILDVK